MIARIGPPLLIAALGWTVAANASTLHAPAAAVVAQAPMPFPTPGLMVPSPPSPSPQPTQTPTDAPGRFHLHRPGTDVDGDQLMGNLASDAFILKGNVTLQSDPTIDTQIAAMSESRDPLTVTADEIDIDRAGLSYVAKGHVRFHQGDRSGRADIAMLNEEQHTLDLIGNANIYDGGHRAAADKMHYNTLDKQFHGSGDVRLFNPVPTPNPNASSTPGPKKHKRRIPL